MTKADVSALLRSVLGGGAVGLPWLLITIPVGIVLSRDGRLLDGLMFGIMPVAVAGGLTLLGMTLIILPATALLSATKNESVTAYVLIGALFGLAIPIAIIAVWWLPSDLVSGGTVLFALKGALAGAIAATIWGRHRQSLPSRQEQSPNPIHDLIH